MTVLGYISDESLIVWIRHVAQQPVPVIPELRIRIHSISARIRTPAWKKACWSDPDRSGYLGFYINYLSFGFPLHPLRKLYTTLFVHIGLFLVIRTRAPKKRLQILTMGEKAALEYPKVKTVSELSLADSNSKLGQQTSFFIMEFHTCSTYSD